MNNIQSLENENRELKARLSELSKVNERLEGELSMAVKLKYHMMPNIYPAFPDVGDFDIYADSIQIEQVGGDFYDFFRIDYDHIGIVIADIFDGGTAAALYMVAFKLLLTSQISMDNTLSEKIESVNDNLCWKNEDDLCLSAWYGIYEISTGRLSCVNAGHERTLLSRKKKLYLMENEEISYLLGVIDGMKYTSYDIILEPGDKIILYTDGVINSRDNTGECYGKKRLKAACDKTHGLTCEETVAALESDFSKFIDKSGLGEDASFLCFSRRGGEDG